MDINRGDAFDFLVSVSSASRGLQEYAQAQYPEGHAKRQETYQLGDVNTSLIRTKQGRTIVVKHDTNLPRPYSRDIMVQGTRGLVHKYPKPILHIEGKSPAHSWEELQTYNQHEHPLWTTMQEQAKGAGHGGMDYIEDYRLIEALLKGRPMDMDVYDAAAWSAVVEMSERSVAQRGRSIDFPDFTRGGWKQPRELEVMKPMQV